MKALYSLAFAAFFLLAAGYASPYSHETGSTSTATPSVRPHTEMGKTLVHTRAGEGPLAVR